MTTSLRLDNYDYLLPPELIALEPVTQRDAARLMTVERTSGDISESVVADLIDLLHPGDLLVLNDTRVLPARFFGVKESGGKVEIFLVRRREAADEQWQVLLRSSKPPRPGMRLVLAEDVVATVMGRADGESWLVNFTGTADFFSWLERHGAMPLPPYIRRQAAAADQERYQTVFARERGAVAAPTAGLHFTTELLERLRAKGVAIATVTLHVGLGTFLPVRVDDLREHRMHKELYRIPNETAAAIADCKAAGGRVVAVGTTTTRALEHAAASGELATTNCGEADIFIYPGYRFRVVDALITNFHLPKSTLLMLVSAFAGRDLILRAYQEAVARRFRFYSYGDAMLIF